MKLRDYQTKVCDDARDLARAGHKRILIQAETGSGKAQPLSAKVLTPTGWALMGELEVGDLVIGSDGGAHAVTGVFPQGLCPVYRVLFSDGSRTRCTAEHLWTVRTRLHKWRGQEHRAMTLAEIKENAKPKNYWFVPVVQPVQFQEQPVPLDPYLLGVLIGNGSLKYHVSVSTADAQVLEAIALALPGDLKLRPVNAYDYRISNGRSGGKPNPVLDALRLLGLHGKGSPAKFVPPCYLYNSVAVRLAMLQGLMDTDGTASGQSAPEFTTTSPQLARDICDLIRSLGGCTKVRPRSPTTYTHNGERRLGLPSYRVRVSLAGICPFRGGRKAKLYNMAAKQGQTKAIAAIEPDGEEFCQCISVDAPDALYVTDDYILTHNTVIAAAIILQARAKGKRCIFIARGRELVNQMSRTLWDMGVPHGIIMRGEDLFLPTSVQVASKDTLMSWCLTRKKHDLPESDVVFVDECHESISKGWRKIIDAYPQAHVLGMTATPARSDGKGLGDIYQAMAMAVPTSQLIREGWIVPCKVFAPYTPNLKGVKLQGGDYQIADLSKRMNQPQLVGNVVGNWIDLGEKRKTIVYACDIKHALYIRDCFREKNIAAELVTGETPTPERDSLFENFAKPEGFTVLVNVAVAKQGVDIPIASCVVLARPTRSYVFFRQAIGRGRRPYPGKTNLLVLDHAGAVYFHGLPDEDVDWFLEPSIKIQDKHHKKLADKGKLPIICPLCHAVFNGTTICPNCGHQCKKRPQDKEKKNGKLVHVSCPRGTPEYMESSQRYWRKCLAVMYFKNTSAGAAAQMYFSRFQEWPWDNNNLKPMPGRGNWKTKVKELFPDLKFGGRT